jgi:hypothetical protein
MNFEQFIQSQWRNYWIDEGTLRIYVRKTPEKYRYRWGDIQLASMENKNPGKGDLAKFLNKWELCYQFYIENVFNLELEKFFLKRGYIQVNEQLCLPKYPSCLMGPDSAIINDMRKIVMEYYTGDKDD